MISNIKFENQEQERSTELVTINPNLEHLIVIAPSGFNPGKVLAFCIKTVDFSSRCVERQMTTEDMKKEIEKGSTLGNRINCQIFLWQRENLLEEGKKTQLGDPNGIKPAEIEIILKTTIEGRNVIILLVTTGYLKRVFAFLWLKGVSLTIESDNKVNIQEIGQLFQQESYFGLIESIEIKLNPYREHKISKFYDQPKDRNE